MMKTQQEPTNGRKEGLFWLMCGEQPIMAEQAKPEEQELFAHI